MKPIRLRLAWCCCFVLAVALSTSAQIEKQVATGPEDVLAGRIRLPEPSAVAERSRYALWPVPPEGELSVALPTAEAGVLSIGVIAIDPSSARLFIGAGARATFEVSRLVAGGLATQTVGAVDVDRSALRYEVYKLPRLPSGDWTLRLEVSSAPAWLVVSDANQVAATAYLSSLTAVSDRPVALLARLESAAGAPWNDGVLSANAVLETTFGEFSLVLTDDGEHADGSAGDGLYGAYLPFGLSGKITARVELRGSRVVRTAHHLFHVLDPDVELTGRAAARVADDRLEIEIGAEISRPTRVHLSAEVWGLDARGTRVPVAWVSRMLPVGAERLTLELDGRWLALARVSRELELRHVRVQDPATGVPWRVLESIPLGSPALPATAFDEHVVVDDAMRMGLASTSAQGAGSTAQATPQAALPALMITHGWCSSSIWPNAHFSAPKVFFVDPSANRTNDEFALLLRSFGQSNSLASYGIVAHSQGGLAALQLYTYYQSGLDAAQGPRLIQSVGSPYQGTPLASFGFLACGDNNDLTPTGASMWLAGIPTWARQSVWYRTTSNSGSVCNTLANLFLGSPNDGVVERFRGELPGGNFVGHDLGWCHSTGMSNPPHYTDAVFNQAMDGFAAR